ncbi:carboxymuconolactone decarboxylase family protein [Rhodococcus rhodochrous]|uniref:carboxymuconolactone decarboxylase family protein n=1 Tax=Rhodococcus rhodochrous TaxID=1829 RepID=UPI0003118DAF|nr:carboxymuconolactone decarboxylase family protein [Rhodococcus rhodochrous]
MPDNYLDKYARVQALMGRLGHETPATMSGFASLHTASTADGALPRRIKELMALAIGIAVHCDGCLAYHVHDALKAGASRSEIMESIGVAIMMGGGPAVVYGCEALEAIDEFGAAAE